MKKIVLLLIAAVGYIHEVSAQTDAKAKIILNEVSKKYRSYDVVKADFTLIINNQQANAKDTQEGTLYVKANANKYKVNMTTQDMISDGKTLWTYLKEEKEVQVTNVNHSDDALNPAKIFTIYEKGFKYLYTGDNKIGTKVYQMIDLTPTDINKSYFKIRLSIDKAAKQIASALILEKNGNRYTYNVKTFVANVKVPESTFTFDAKKYPGVEVVDLR
ncbi:MAG: outer membrane lipoprotein carrier protein LolA [Candidatus Pedobacter colombiensis]|uniref:Outer membrane lipoprotein carrier protein LolA n=1 Tax=Candidatus Pedobacter colombiensis TaxID=3121371 RepID=A0AAJ5W6R8_9SPHI|nr:outer membrane lipoprotein carrier protein LolA [Pedobacter sp.]WEK18160.1 MAG: outer membrane lipoprotein carrier protein LolA [Pedobacter sp.]